MNVFEVADYEEKTAGEKARQADRAGELGYESTADIKPNVFQKAAAELAKENKTPGMPGKLPSNLNAMRRRLGMQQTAVDGEGGEGFAKKAYDFIGGRTGIGATGGAILGTALGPSTGGLSLLIPALAAGGGGALGALTEGKSPIKEGLKEGLMQGAGGVAGKGLKPAWQFAKESVMKTFGSRELVSEAAESLLKKWLSPATKAADLYAIGQGMQHAIPPIETTRVVDDLIQHEIGRVPLDTQKEIMSVLKPLERFYQPRTASGQRYFVAQEVPDFMAEVRRLRLEATRAFKADNSDLGNAINKVRGAMLDDMEAHGAGVVKEASKAYRKEMAIEDLAREMARPSPGTKIKDFARKHPLFDKAFSPAEKAQIDRIVKKVAFVAPSGASGVLGKIATTTAGGVAMGPLGGIFGYVAPEYIRTLLASPTGRNFMEKTLEGNYRMGQGRVVQSIGPLWSIFARGLMRGGEPETEQ